MHGDDAEVLRSLFGGDSTHGHTIEYGSRGQISSINGRPVRWGPNGEITKVLGGGRVQRDGYGHPIDTGYHR